MKSEICVCTLFQYLTDFLQMIIAWEEQCTRLEHKWIFHKIIS